jgi:hypothetical protein
MTVDSVLCIASPSPCSPLRSLVLPYVLVVSTHVRYSYCRSHAIQRGLRSFELRPFGDRRGGFILVRSSNGSYEMIDMRETMPAAGNETMYSSHGANQTLSTIGGLAVGVPGEIRGWEALVRTFLCNCSSLSLVMTFKLFSTSGMASFLGQTSLHQLSSSIERVSRSPLTSPRPSRATRAPALYATILTGRKSTVTRTATAKRKGM